MVEDEIKISLLNMKQGSSYKMKVVTSLQGTMKMYKLFQETHN